MADIGTSDSCLEQHQWATCSNKKIDKIFSDIPNIFDNVDDILVIGNDEDDTDHDAMVHKVLQRCEVNLKLNKEKCHLGAHPSLSLEK